MKEGKKTTTQVETRHEGTRLFQDFPEISSETASVLQSNGFSHASPVQEATIPLLLNHRDACVEACTGSGKTLAFVIPVVEILRRNRAEQAQDDPQTTNFSKKGNKILALIVSPTRELARQIFEVAKPLVESVGDATAELVVGGRSNAEEDLSRIEENAAEVLIGTPGRVYDLLCCANKRLKLPHLEILILDEADRILDEGFKQQLNNILTSLPKQRRTGLFSATQTEEVKQLARAGLRNPFKVVVRQQFRSNPSTAASKGSCSQKVPCSDVRTPGRLSLQYLICSPNEKLEILVSYIQRCAKEKGIVYLLTCACVEFCSKALKECGLLDGFDIWSLHGKMKQNARNTALASFTKAKEGGVLLCTDVAARGLDIPAVEWIVQLDPPQDPSFFIHRVGRTARMGQSGRALLFLNRNEEPYVSFLQKRKVPVSERLNLERCQDVAGRIKKLTETDRDLLDKSIRAFVTYIRAYTEHQCQYIFRLKELDVGNLANSFGLLRLPKMKEIKKIPRHLQDTFQASSVDPDTVPYKDKAREKQRKEKMKKLAAELQASKGDGGRRGGNNSNSNNHKHQKQKEKRLNSAKRHKIDSLQDDLELEEDWKLFKKLKKGQITEDEYDNQCYLSHQKLQNEMDKRRKKKVKKRKNVD